MPPILASVDRAGFAVALALRLRRAGVAVGLASIDAFVAGLITAQPGSITELYWVARVTLVRRSEDLRAFEDIFKAIFAASTVSIDPNARRHFPEMAPGAAETYAPVPLSHGSDDIGGGLPWTTLPDVLASSNGHEDIALRLPERLASSFEATAEPPFEPLRAEQLRVLDEALHVALENWPTRRSRRMARHHAGHAVSLRSTLARARRSGFEPLELARSRPVRKPRPVVMLCDVSQSMQHQATAYLHLMRAVAMTTQAEVFAFSTRLTRLSAVLAHKSPELAMQQATAKVTDRFGGTRIATSVLELLSSSRGNACRGAIVLIASDGWDSDPPGQLGVAMARLRRRAHRIIWLNPRMAAPGFAPEVASMAAALPFCDELLPADTIGALLDVVSAIVRSG